MLTSALRTSIDEFIQQENLPDSYLETVEQWFLPVLEELLTLVSRSTSPPVIGVSGCQGSGKSTLASLLVLLLRESMGLRSINLSIDDFYLTRAEREALASTVHPLLATRGVPGTHDVALAKQTISALSQAGEVAIPRFEKGIDDRAALDTWPKVTAPVDVIILEGWCLSIGAEPETALVDPVNKLENEEDSSGEWRRYVNASIQAEYQSLYDTVDFLIMLKAPSFDKVYEWRQNQEDKLRARLLAEGKDLADSQVMSQPELQRFIQHYERVTRHGLKTLPAKADVVFELTGEQTIARRI